MSKFVEGFEKKAAAPFIGPPKPGPFEALRRKAMSTKNIVRMNVGKTIVGAGAVAGLGYKAMDIASGSEPTRPDW